MIYFLLLLLTHQNSIQYYNIVKVFNNISNFAKVIFNRVVFCHDFLSFFIINKNFIFLF